ncbi:MAG: arylsulfatase [Planctomycetes bacterium]|nr:arylsulfatase [Planctomycetota bacterium]
MLTSGCQEYLANNSSKRKPNIVYILADDLGYGDVSSFNENGKINTENIDSIAKAGMAFTDAHSGSGVCTPTRYGVITGRYAWRTHLKRGVLGGWSKPLIKPDRMTVASMLKENGYNTGCIGKWHLGWQWHLKNKDANTDDWMMDAKNVDFSKPITNGPRTRGFDYHFGIAGSLDMTPYVYVENGMPTAVPDRIIDGSDGQRFWRKGAISPDFQIDDVLPKITEKAVGFIERQSKDKPFFLYFPLTAPHVPLVPTEEFKGKSGLNAWGDFVLQVDWTVGQILKTLKQNGFDKNTLVILTSDNGPTPKADFKTLEKKGHDPSGIFRGAKADVYEGGHRIPFIAKWPGKIKPGSTSDETICLTDLMATAADIANYKLPDNAGEDSVSILPVLLGEKHSKPLREATVHHSMNGSFSIRKGNWKLLLCPGSGGWSKPRPGKDSMKGLPPIQLYDLEKDIKETNNLQDKYPEKVKELTALLQSYVDAGRSTPGTKQKNTGKTPIMKKKNTRK